LILIPLIAFKALERNPAVCHALKETPDWEVASHGYRWIDYRNVDEETEREHIERTIKVHEKLLGKRPVGLYQGKVRFVPQNIL
jgi:allantoinase